MKVEELQILEIKLRIANEKLLNDIRVIREAWDGLYDQSSIKDLLKKAISRHDELVRTIENSIKDS